MIGRIGKHLGPLDDLNDHGAGYQYDEIRDVKSR